MRVLLNSVAAKMGGALSYVRNFLSTLAASARDDEYFVFVQSFLKDELSALSPNIHVETSPLAERGQLGRLFFDQWTLRRLARERNVDCLFSTANFATLAPPVPEIVSVRNPIYYSRHYYEHVRRMEGRRAVLRVSLRRRMVNLSMSSSAVVVTPTAAMRDMLLDWRAVPAEKCIVIHHGFDRERFLSMEPRDAGQLRLDLARRDGETLLLYPSLYAKHKNFDTLISALPILARRGNFRLLLACCIDPRANPYERRTWRLIEQSGAAKYITMLGNQPYANMPLLYAAADLVVWPTFAESFGHPLVETMACGKPAVASDIPVNREILGQAGLFFEPFSPEDLAEKVVAALEKPATQRLIAAASERVNDFSWQKHVSSFVELFAKVSGKA